MNHHLIILAGGTGTRMNSDIPKQFLLLNDIPVIVHTIRRFTDWNPDLNIVVAANLEFFDKWNTICEEHLSDLNIQTVQGGAERFHSVKNALQCIPETGVVGLHDAARPLVAKSVIEDCFKMASEHGSAIPVISLSESLRKVLNNASVHVNRSEYKVVQTPQVFRSKELKTAYEQDYQLEFTDDASVFEANGGKIHLVEGNKENIKITEPVDLKLAEALLS